MKDGNAEIEDLLCESLGKAELTRLMQSGTARGDSGISRERGGVKP